MLHIQYRYTNMLYSSLFVSDLTPALPSSTVGQRPGSTVPSTSTPARLAFPIAACVRSVSFLQWAYNHSLPRSRETVRVLLREGSSECIQWALRQDFPWSSDDTAWASTERPDVFNCMIVHGLPVDVDSLLALVREGRLTTLKWVWLKRPEVMTESHWVDVAVAAARWGRLDTLRWVNSQTCAWRVDQVMITATEYGQLDIVRWLYRHRCPTHRLALQGAMYGNHIDIVKWWVSTYGWKPEYFDYIVESGNVHLADWAYTRFQACRVSHDSLLRARDAEQHDMIRWVSEHTVHLIVN